MKKKSGFTLVEVSVCIVLLGLLISSVFLVINYYNDFNLTIKNEESAINLSNNIFSEFKSNPNVEINKLEKLKDNYALELVITKTEENSFVTLKVKIEYKDKILVSRELTLKGGTTNA